MIDNYHGFNYGTDYGIIIYQYLWDNYPNQAFTMVSGGTDYESPTLWISRPGDLPGNPPEAVAEVFQELLTSEFQGVCLGWRLGSSYRVTG